MSSSSDPFQSFGAFFDPQRFMASAPQGMDNLKSVLSSWAVPTLDLDELDKRIKDLKTVQFWLEQNQQWIEATIKTLEVQRMTLATLHSMNVNMADMQSAFKATDPASTTTTQSETPPAPPPLIDPMQWWNTMTEQFAHMAQQASSPMAPRQDSATSTQGEESAEPVHSTPPRQTAAKRATPSAKKSTAKKANSAAKRSKPSSK